MYCNTPTTPTSTANSSEKKQNNNKGPTLHSANNYKWLQLLILDPIHALFLAFLLAIKQTRVSAGSMGGMFDSEDRMKE